MQNYPEHNPDPDQKTAERRMKWAQISFAVLAGAAITVRYGLEYLMSPSRPASTIPVAGRAMQPEERMPAVPLPETPITVVSIEGGRGDDDASETDLLQDKIERDPNQKLLTSDSFAHVNVPEEILGLLNKPVSTLNSLDMRDLQDEIEFWNRMLFIDPQLQANPRAKNEAKYVILIMEKRLSEAQAVDRSGAERESPEFRLKRGIRRIMEVTPGDIMGDGLLILQAIRDSLVYVDESLNSMAETEELHTYRATLRESIQRLTERIDREADALIKKQLKQNGGQETKRAA